MSRVLVTGGAGFIGSHVSDLFARRGWTVDIIDDLSTGKRDNVSTAALHVLDVRSLEAATLAASGRFDTIVHLAGQMDVRRSVIDPMFDASVNVLGTLNVLEAVRRSPRATETRIVFSSTGGAVYGDHVRPPNAETTLKEPDSPYAIAKLAVEYYLSYYGRIHGLDTVSLRFGNVYGPRQDPHGEAGVVAIFGGRILEGRALTIFGDGQQTRDYIHVGDVADAVYRAVTERLPSARHVDDRAFNVGTGIGTSVLEIASVLRQVAQSEVSVEFAPPRPGEQQDSFLSVAKIRDGLGWSPTWSLDRGLSDTFAWFVARAAGSLSRP